VIIIAREELNKAASGLSQPRKEAASFDKWMAPAMGRTVEAATADRSESSVSALQSLYKNRLTRFE
jgi:hypothetical protein